MTVSARFRIIRELGKGETCVVFLVEDQLHAQRVAKKVLLRPDPALMRRFKREFRTVEQFRHPNLVRVFELGEEEGLYFTMEFIEGADLLQHVEGFCAAFSGSAISAKIAFLTKALPQILDALSFLHQQRIVHCDLKPGNILVTPDDRIKLLDFGILAEMSRPRSRSEGTWGSIGYAAPEIILHRDPEPASDAYSLGCILYQILTDRPVFQGTTEEILRQHVDCPPPPLLEIGLEVPPILVDACLRLLAKTPSDRPSMEALRRLLLPVIGAPPPTLVQLPGCSETIIGREEEMASLFQHLNEMKAGKLRVITLEGPTGVGKTTLARWVSKRASHDGMAVFHGRGRRNDHTTFNAIDGAIDELSLFLEAQPQLVCERLEEGLRIASTIFPVLGTGQAPQRKPPRALAFSALSGLLLEIGRVGRGVLIFIDDLQWADEDSLTLLEHLVSVGSSWINILAVLRNDVGETKASRWIYHSKQLVRFIVHPLNKLAIASIITALAKQAIIRADEPWLLELAEACQGRPFLAEVMGRILDRHGRSDRQVKIVAGPKLLLKELSPQAMRLLLLLAAGNDWIEVQELATIEGLGVLVIEEQLQDMARDGLVRLGGQVGQRGTVDLYHDEIRRVLLEIADESDIRQAHQSLADYLGRQPSLPYLRLVRHLDGAGRRQEAAAWAREAARMAESMLAFNLAGEMYALALFDPRADELDLRRCRALVLEKSGHYQEAAEAWRDIASRSDEVEIGNAKISEAHNLLAANEVSAGRRCLQEALDRQGDRGMLRKGPSWVLAGLRFLIGPIGPTRTPSSSAAHDPALAESAEQYFRIGLVVSYFDPLAGMHFLQRARSRFERGGLLARASACDLVFAYLAMFTSNQRKPVRLAKRYQDAADRRVQGGKQPSDYVSAFSTFIEGVSAQRLGMWADARKRFDLSLDQFECQGLVGTFEHELVAVHRLQLELFAQNLDAYWALERRFHETIRHSRDSAVRSLHTLLQVIGLNLTGDPQGSAELGAELQREWEHSEPVFQSLLVRVVTCFPELYRGDCLETRALIHDALRKNRRHLPLGNMYSGFIASIAALAEANALRAGDRGASMHRLRRYARVARDAPPFLSWGCLRALAYGSDALGLSPQTALGHLEQAEACAARYGQTIEVAIGRYQRGRRLGGEEGEVLMASSRQMLEDMGSSTELLEEDWGGRH